MQWDKFKCFSALSSYFLSSCRSFAFKRGLGHSNIFGVNLRHFGYWHTPKYERSFTYEDYLNFVTPTVCHFKYHPLANPFTYLSDDEIDCPMINFIQSKDHLPLERIDEKCLLVQMKETDVPTDLVFFAVGSPSVLLGSSGSLIPEPSDFEPFGLINCRRLLLGTETSSLRDLFFEPFFWALVVQVVEGWETRA